MRETVLKKLVVEVPDLPYDVVFKILLLLPAKDLYKFSFVCKTWYNLINSSAFIDAHLCLCESSLIFLNRIPSNKNRSNTLSIETHLGLSDDDHPSQFNLFAPSTSRQQKEYYIKFLEILQDKGKVSDPNICGVQEIVETCNGLILVPVQKNQSLLVMNPVTRKIIRFPLGTIAHSSDESYGFIFLNHKREYKVVHLYRVCMQFIGCEVLSLRTKSWHAIDGPTPDQFRGINPELITASESLYWLPASKGCSYLVSMGMDDEKFITRPLPVNNTTYSDRLVEIRGVLSFVGHVTKYRMQLWTLKGSEKHAEDWVKQYTIIMAEDVSKMIPVFAMRNGSRLIFFEAFGEDFLPVYDFQDEEMKKVELEIQGTGIFNPFTNCLPHLSSLASWEDLQPW